MIWTNLWTIIMIASTKKNHYCEVVWGRQMHRQTDRPETFKGAHAGLQKTQTSITVFVAPNPSNPRVPHFAFKFYVTEKPQRFIYSPRTHTHTHTHHQLLSSSKWFWQCYHKICSLITTVHPGKSTLFAWLTQSNNHDASQTRRQAKRVRP